MPAVPFGLSAYQRADLPPILLKNFYFEKVPSKQDQVSLFPRPRLKQWALVGTGPMQGMYREGGVIFGRLIVRSGSKLYKVEQTGTPGVGTATELGTVAGTGLMSAEGDATRVVMTFGSTVYYTNGTTLSTLALPGGESCIAVDTLDTRFLFACASSNQFYWSDVGTLTVGALSYANAESQPDVLVSLKVVDDIVWLIGRLSLEAWRPTGDADLPFERIEGRIFGIGCTARDTVRKMNVEGLDTMCWVGTDRRVYRLSPNPTRISDFGMEERLSRATPEDLYATSTNWNGHDFYVLHIPGEGSFAYDMQIGQWSEWTSFGRDLFRANCATTGPNNQPLLGDDETGVIYEFSEELETEATDPVVYEATAYVETEEPVRCSNVRLDVTTGSEEDSTIDPTIEMAVSDDKGRTFRSAERKPLGRIAERNKRVMWFSKGFIRPEHGLLMRWRTNLPVVLNKANLNTGVK